MGWSHLSSAGHIISRIPIVSLWSLWSVLWWIMSMLTSVWLSSSVVILSRVLLSGIGRGDRVRIVILVVMLHLELRQLGLLPGRLLLLHRRRVHQLVVLHFQLLDGVRVGHVA